jgi:hypothetical protein
LPGAVPIQGHVRKSVALLAAGAIVAAAIAAILGLWLPARHQRQDAAWTAAGERALARVALPSPYSADLPDEGSSTATVLHGIEVCSNGPEERCFLGPGDPPAQVTTVHAALANVATGRMHASCSPTQLQGSPDSCHLVVPVAGSRLAVELFAHPRDRSAPISQWTYSGAYVLIHVDRR